MLFYFQEIPWSAEVTASGWFAVWFEKKVDGHHLWFIPISDHVNSFYLSGTEPVEWCQPSYRKKYDTQTRWKMFVQTCGKQLKAEKNT